MRENRKGHSFLHFLIMTHKDSILLRFALKDRLWLHVRTASFYVLSKNKKNEILQPLKVIACCIDMFA